MQLNDHLTAAEAAAMLGVSVRTIERLRAAGELGYVTVGRKVRVYYPRADVIAYQARVTAPVIMTGKDS